MSILLTEAPVTGRGSLSPPSPPASTFVAPDVHGNLDLLALLLQKAEVLDDGWERINRDIRTVQIGDLCNCVASSVVDDMRCLDHVSKWFDVYLVGNHEHPYFGGPEFSGFHRDMVIHHRLRTLNSTGLIRPCINVDGILVSHAGLTEPFIYPSAEVAEDWIDELWGYDPQANIFSGIGHSRGGRSRYGGILWADWDEPKLTTFSQLVGHTVGDEVRIKGYPQRTWSMCIDVEKSERLTGAMITDGQVELITATEGE